jgi:hypothetical protein
MPIENYSFGNIPRPGERLLSGIKSGVGIQDLSNRRDIAIAAQQKQQALNESIANLNEIENPTAAEYTKVTSLLPKEQADSLRANWELRSKEYQANLLQSAGQTLAAFTAKPEVAMNLLRERAESERNSGNEADADFLDRLVSVAEIDPKLAKQTLGIMISSMPGGDKVIDSIRRAQGPRAGASAKAFAPVTLVNESTGEKIPHIPTFDPSTGKAKLEPADLPEGFTLSKETAVEKRQAEIATVGAKEGAKITGKGQAKRLQDTIETGVVSSEGLANLKRARTLLDTVKTGGINAASLRAKQLFGVEGADEGELSNRLGKSVLAQLRQTFGAAFTAQEGASLARIEAGFGKSPAANKKLIDQLIKMVAKKSNQGIAAAVEAEDFTTAALIKENMAFSLDDAEPETAAPLPETTTSIPVTRLKFNPETGLIE